MKTVILCGGDSLRFQNLVFENSKVMALIGNKPLVWHIMNIYAKSGYKDFILCVKDNDTDIHNYFKAPFKDWKVQVVKTGNTTTTGGRVKMIQPFIKENKFMVTYGDGISNINISELVNFHKNHKKMGTLTAVKPISQYGILNIDKKDSVLSFEEKPQMNDWINGGFFIFNYEVFNSIDEKLPLETGLLNRLSENNNLMAFKHDGFWKSMDTYKEYMELNELWE